jgi:ABC-2 type transport system ATP-binding protein
VEKVCTHAAILKSGTLLMTGNVDEIMMDEDLVELSASDLTALVGLINKISSKVSVDETLKTVQFSLPKGTAKMDEINSYCFNNGVTLTQLVLRKKRLEARFFELTNN